ncbi:MAG: M28 family peptidase [Haloferacaceae archaeon]
MTDWIGETYLNGAGWEHVERLVEIGPRPAGSDAERAAAAATREALEAVGARNARTEEFPIQGWTRGSSALHHPASGDETETLAFARSPSGEATGRLVDVGHGLADEVDAAPLEGAVALVRNHAPEDHERVVHRQEKYARVVGAGARAYVERNHLPGCLPRSGYVRGADGAPLGEVPAVSVSHEAGARLARRAVGDPVTVAVDAETGEATSRNVLAEVGPETDERVVVSAHLDGSDVSESAGDDAVGVGAVVGVAEALARRARELETTVRLVAFGAEELPLLGARHRAERADLDRVRAVVQNDGLGRARDLAFLTHGSDALAGLAREVAGAFDHPARVSPDLYLSSDNWRYVERGVPAYLVGSVTPDGAPTHGPSNANVLTPADTLDKLDPRDLRAGVLLETELVVRLAERDRSVPRIRREDLDAQLEREGKAHKAELYEQFDY